MHGPDLLAPLSVPNVPSISTVVRISDTLAKVFWVPLTPDEARGVLTELQIAYQPSLNGTCAYLDYSNMQVMTIQENIDTQSVAVIDGLEEDKEYCVGIQVSTVAGESGFSNTLKAHCKLKPDSLIARVILNGGVQKVRSVHHESSVYISL